MLPQAYLRFEPKRVGVPNNGEIAHRRALH